MLKILPIGDEVVVGDGASGGFRQPLQQLLELAKIEFEFVGREDSNSFEMLYPHHEGQRNIGITQLREDVLEPALGFGPDIVLIYAGLEDVRSLPDAGIAIARYRKFVDALSGASPELLIICSQLIQSKEYLLEQRIKAFNRGLGSMIEQISKRNRRVSRVKMHSRVKTENINVAGMPNEAGYAAMATAWFEAIEEQLRRKSEA